MRSNAWQRFAGQSCPVIPLIDEPSCCSSGEYYRFEEKLTRSRSPSRSLRSCENIICFNSRQRMRRSTFILPFPPILLMKPLLDTLHLTQYDFSIALFILAEDPVQTQSFLQSLLALSYIFQLYYFTYTNVCISNKLAIQ
jgi:hypothetical protein